jgi:hypothetical protein
MAFDRDAHKRKWNRERAQKNTSLVNRWKMTKGCKQCGYKKHPSALVLDHIDPMTKDRNKRNGRAYNPLWSKVRLKEELTKVQVLCACCHNIRTYEEEHYKFGGSGQ